MRKTTTILASVASLALIGGVAYAVAPGPVPEPDGTIHMCYNKTNGSIIKVVTPSTGMDCSGSEGKVIWNQTGPQGIPGPAGAASIYLHTVTDVIPVGTNPTLRTYDCPNGDESTGGAVAVNGQSLVTIPGGGGTSIVASTSAGSVQAVTDTGLSLQVVNIQFPAGLPQKNDVDHPVSYVVTLKCSES